MAAPGVDPPVPTPEPAPVNPGPWAADLAEYFGDNAEAVAAADRYMREKVQPRMTQIEQDSAAARSLYEELTGDPSTVLPELIEEMIERDMLDPELATKFSSIFGEPTPAEPVTPAEPGAPAVDPETAEMREWYRQQRDREAQQAADAEYQQVKADLRTAHPDLTDDDMDLIDPFIAGPGQGIPEQGYAAYQAWKQKFVAVHGAAPAPAEPTTPTAPPVLGGEAAPAATPPVTKVYKDLDEAVRDFFAEQRAAAPPVVGSA